jgi:competence protein ComEA
MGFSKEQHVVLLLLGLLIFSIDLFRPFHPVWSIPCPASTNLMTSSSPQWIVEVAGDVKSPGVYVFHSSPTGNDAVQRAGGEMKEDGIPLSGMKTPLESGTRVERITSAGKSDRAIISPMEPAKKFVLGIPIPLNQTGAEDLAIIPGISESLAHRIMAFRDANGPFRSFCDLDRVKGIGPKKLERLRSYLSLTETSLNQQ